MNYIKMLNFKINTYLRYFLTYSFIGWCLETAYMSFIKGRFVNGGFFNLPFRPIYGFGAILLILLLKSVRHNPLLLFIGAVLLTSILEYSTGVFLQMAFHRTLWNYNGEFLNIGGFICLKFSVYWGVLSTLFLCVVQPITRYILNRIPRHIPMLVFYSILFTLIF